MQFTFGDKGEVYLQDKSALPVTKKESMQEGKRSIGPRMKYGHANLKSFAHIQTEGAAYSTFHFFSFVPVRHTNLYLSVCFKTYIARFAKFGGKKLKNEAKRACFGLIPIHWLIQKCWSSTLDTAIVTIIQEPDHSISGRFCRIANGWVSDPHWIVFPGTCWFGSPTRTFGVLWLRNTSSIAGFMSWASSIKRTSWGLILWRSGLRSW